MFFMPSKVHFPLDLLRPKDGPPCIQSLLTSDTLMLPSLSRQCIDSK